MHIVVARLVLEQQLVVERQAVGAARAAPLLAPAAGRAGPGTTTSYITVYQSEADLKLYKIIQFKLHFKCKDF